MEPLEVYDTIAYKIFDQIASHIFPSEEFSEDDFMKIYRAYQRSGGNWESLVHGDMSSYDKLIGTLKAFVKIRKHPKKYGLK
jgi:hypothetical protein